VEGFLLVGKVLYKIDKRDGEKIFNYVPRERRIRKS